MLTEWVLIFALAVAAGLLVYRLKRKTEQHRLVEGHCLWYWVHDR